MPTVNIYYGDEDYSQKLKSITPELKILVAKELSGKSINLSIDEVSVRLIRVEGDGMLTEVELEIHAAAFEERVKRQDEICLIIQKFLQEALDTNVNVWLILSELGHSWENI